MRYKNGAPEQVYIPVNLSTGDIYEGSTTLRSARVDAVTYATINGDEIKVFTYILKEKK